MSKVFIDKNYKIHRLLSIQNWKRPGHHHVRDSDTQEESIIDQLCNTDHSSNPNIKRIKKRLANCILSNELYKALYNRFVAGSGLIPATSRLFTNGRTINDNLELSDILKHLLIKTKMNEFEYNNKSLRIGHFRFKLSNIIPVQFIILIEIKPGVLLLMTKCMPKLSNVFTDYLVNVMGCFINSLSLSNDFLMNIINDTIATINLNNIGGLELTYGSIKTQNNALNSIMLNLENHDISKFTDHPTKADTRFLQIFYQHLDNQTAINFNQIQLTRIRCSLFTISTEGKIRFTSEMSFLPDPENYEDLRPSIWGIMFKICDLCVDEQSSRAANNESIPTDEDD